MGPAVSVRRMRGPSPARSAPLDRKLRASSSVSPPSGPITTVARAGALPGSPPARATVVVGPEGGLTDEEARSLRSAGALLAGLGPRILRTETAGPVALALLQSRYGDLER